jgi:hypothetical protein
METRPYRRPSLYEARWAGVYVTLLLTVAAVAASWKQVSDGGAWHVAASCFGIGALVGLVFQARARSMRRLRIALDLYAEREMAREPSRRIAAHQLVRGTEIHSAA